MNLGGTFYNGQNIKSSTTKYLIVDSGTSLIYLTKSDYQNFIAQVSEESSMICDSTVYDFCYSKHKHCHEVAPYLKDLVIQIDNQNYTIPPSGYLLDHMSGTRCGIAISSIDYNLYILGDTFMRNFYTSFDFSTL